MNRKQAIYCLGFLLLIAARPAVCAVSIDNVGVSAIKTDSVVIDWESATAGISRIEYSVDTAYNTAVTADGYSFFHETELNGLAAGTSYHYRIRARDYYGAETVSPEYTFTTRTQSELNSVIQAVRQDGGLPKTYYVKTDGNDNADGLAVGTAWRSPAYAVGKADAGDTICLLDGTWTNEQLVFANSGIDVAPITLTTNSGARTAVLQGVNYTGIAINANFKDYIHIRNLIIRNYGGGIHSLGSRTSIYNCEIGNCSGTLTGIDGHLYARKHGRGLRNVLFAYNKLHDTGQTGGASNMMGFGGAHTDGGEAPAGNIAFIGNDVYGKSLHQVLNIQSYNPPTFSGIGLSRMVFRGNEIHDLNYGGNAFYTIYGVAEKIVIEKNIIHDIPQDAVKGCFKDSLIIDNDFYSNFGASILFLNVADHILVNNLIANNTILNSQYGMQLTRGSGDDIFGNCAPLYRVNDYPEVIRDAVNQSFQIRSEYGGTVILRYTDGRVFTASKIVQPVYYPDRSEYITQGNEIVGIKSFPMTARPDAGSATVTVAVYDTSLVKGNTLAAFTATAVNGTNVVFALGSLKAGACYQVRREGTDYHVVQANASRCIQFTNLEWPTRTFTVIETDLAADLTTGPEVEVGTPSIVTPNAPRSLAGSFTGETVALSWQVPTYNGGSPITHYNLYRGDSSGGGTLLAQSDLQLAYTDTAIEKGQTYYYRISSVNAVGEGYKSREISVLCAFPPALTVNDVWIYPNPYVKGKSQGDEVRFGNLPKEAEIYIYSLAGARIRKITHAAAADGGGEIWDVGQTAGGIYLVLIQSAQGVRKGKISLVK